MILILLLVSCSKTEKNQEIGSIKKYDLFLKPEEKINYEIRQFDNSLLSIGEASQDYHTQLHLVENTTFRVYYWNDDNYIDFSEQYNITNDINLPISPNLKRGKININTENLREGNLKAIIEMDGYVINPTLCLNHSLTILRVKIKQQQESCESIWLNYSSFTEIKGEKNYSWLQKGQYRCGSYFKMGERDILRNCERIEENICYLNTLKRDHKYDGCWDLPTLNNNNLTLILEVQTIAQLDDNDYLKLDIYDQERNKDNLRVDGIWDYSKREQKIYQKVIIP